jgi:glycosyltransferase involved in cell wall biosynthesis
MLPPVDALAFRAIKRLGIRLVFTVHDIGFRGPKWHQPWRSGRPLYGLADALIVHTEANKRDLRLASGLPAARIHVVASGSELGWARPMVPKDVARSELGLPSEAPLILFFGNIKPYKQLGLLLEALPRILERLPTARLLIVGCPVEPFGRYRRMIDRLGVGDAVLARLGWVSEDEKARCFGAADVVVLPYGETDFSGVLLTAYLFARPVVTTDTGGLRELVDEGATGYVVPPSDHAALADATLRVLRDPVRAARMGERARELALTTYAWPSSARATIEIYKAP